MKIIITAKHRGGARNIILAVGQLIKHHHEIIAIGHGASEELFKDRNIPYETAPSDISHDSMVSLLKSKGPGIDLVFTGTVDRDKGVLKGDVIDQTITEAAHVMGIPTLALLDSCVNWQERFSSPEHPEDLKYLSRNIAVPGEISTTLLEEGLDPSLITVTGAPYFDELPEKARSFSQEQRTSIRKSIGLNNADFLIAYIGTVFRSAVDAYGFWDLDVIRLISEVLDAMVGMEIACAVKLHPDPRIKEDKRAQDITIAQAIGNYIWMSPHNRSNRRRATSC